MNILSLPVEHVKTCWTRTISKLGAKNMLKQKTSQIRVILSKNNIFKSDQSKKLKIYVYFRKCWLLKVTLTVFCFCYKLSVRISVLFCSEIVENEREGKDNHRSHSLSSSSNLLQNHLTICWLVSCCKSHSVLLFENSKLKFFPIFQLAQQKPKTKEQCFTVQVKLS